MDAPSRPPLPLSDVERDLVVRSLCGAHSPELAEALVEAAALTSVLRSLRRTLANGEYALLQMHPTHPWRGLLTIERERLKELIARLERAA